MKVWDADDLGADELLGQVLYSLKDLATNTPVLVTLPLDTQGSICLTLTLIPPNKSAENVPVASIDLVSSTASSEGGFVSVSSDIDGFGILQEDVDEVCMSLMEFGWFFFSTGFSACFIHD